MVLTAVGIIDGRKQHSILFEIFSDKGIWDFDKKMKNLKEMKYLLLDLDGVCYGKHNNYSLEKVFGQGIKRMTMFISERLKIDMKEAKKLQTDYFYKYNTSLNGLMIHHDIPPEEFLRYVHTIDISFMKEDKLMRNELEKLDMEKFIFTNGSAEHAKNILTHLRSI